MAKAKIIQQIHLYHTGAITAHEDMYNGDPATDVVNMEGFDGAVWIITESAGATGTAVVTVEACDDVTPSNTTAIQFTYQAGALVDTMGATTVATASGFTTTAGANKVYIIEADAADIAATGYSYVRMQLTEGVDSPVDGGIVGFLVRGRHKYDQEATVAT